MWTRPLPLVLGALALLAGCASPPYRFPAAMLPTHAELREALTLARHADNGGLDTDMWATIVDRHGVVVAVAHSGPFYSSQWPGSRVISAQKANTANAFSLAGLALSTANLYAAVQPGGSLYGLQHSNPVDVDVAYAGLAEFFGTPDDPMVGYRIGGVNVFGGGLPLYDEGGILVGAVGVSGDTSTADHFIAWRTRHLLGMDRVPKGVSGDPQRPDNIVFDLDAQGRSAGGFGHPHALELAKEAALAAALPPIRTRG